MGVGGEDDKMENGSGGGGGFFESFKVTAEVMAEVKEIGGKCYRFPPCLYVYIPLNINLVTMKIAS